MSKKQCKASRFTLSGLSGNVARSLGSATLSFRVGNSNFNDEMEVVSTVEASYTAIPGLDFLKKTLCQN